MVEMASESDSPYDQLWKEYSAVFNEFDDLTLARWLSQTLAQVEGKVWRMSHPLLGAYRLAAQLAHERSIWHKRLTRPPAAYTEAACCRAPALPLLTREIKESGLICQHCNETLASFDSLPESLQAELGEWATQYNPVHAVAHWDDRQRKSGREYERAFENAAEEAERLLARAGSLLAPKLLDLYPAVVWEDQDECLEVRPEDVRFEALGG